MSLDTLISAVTLGIAALQLKLDHFSKVPYNNQTQDFYALGEGIRTMEFALAETVAFVGETDGRQPNPRLANLWLDASQSLRNIEDGAEFAHVAFEKNLYWSNPNFYDNRNARVLYHISFDNVLNQLRILRVKYDKMQKKMNR